MALGGGTFLVQNKVLPGAYINFISVAQASATLSDRGIVTIPLAMNWGPEGKIFTVEQADFIKNSQKIFGYAYTADELKPMREIFLHAKTVHFFRLGTSGVKAANTYATAKYPGTRGNDLRTVITANENTTEQKPLFDVATFLGTVQVDLQEGVAAITGLKANDYLDWKSSGTLSLTASLPLTGGTNGTVPIPTIRPILIRRKRTPSMLWVVPRARPPSPPCLRPSQSVCVMMWARSFRWFFSVSWPIMKAL